MINSAIKPVTTTLSIDGQSACVEQGISVAAAIAINGGSITRRSVGGDARAPLCGMGVCQECRVTIDGRPHQLACQTLCAEGMQVTTCAGENIL
jgi:aerobic-type carbon monoxide dehydrogenase small subunit (CoxS/CutS family)